MTVQCDLAGGLSVQNAYQTVVSDGDNAGVNICYLYESIGIQYES